MNSELPIDSVGVSEYIKAIGGILAAILLKPFDGIISDSKPSLLSGDTTAILRSSLRAQHFLTDTTEVFITI